MKKRLRPYAPVLATLAGALAGFALWAFVFRQVWSECRETHSWLYCFVSLG